MVDIRLKKFITEILSQKHIITCLALLIFLTLFSSAVYSANIKDLAGREVELPDNLDRIVAVGPGALRLVVYLEAESMVVGIEEFERRDQKKPYILANPELTKLPVIGPQFGGDPELIAAAEPDIVFASYLSKEELNNLSKKTGIPVLSINDDSAGSMTEKELFAALDFMAPILKREGRSDEFFHFLNVAVLISLEDAC